MASKDRQDSRVGRLSAARAEDAAPIGVFDSGLGGLSVVRAIRAALPHENILYYADSRYAPYGARDDGFIIERTLRIGAELMAANVKAIVVACNTATAAAVAALRASYTLPVIGVEPGIKPAATVTRSNVVGVLATASTLASTRFQALLQRVQASAPQVRFISAAGAGWVELVERGELHSPITYAAIDAVLQPLLAQGADTLALGCTHYPFLLDAIQHCTQGTDIHIIDTAPAIARELKRRLEQEALLNNAHEAAGRLRLATSGDIEAVTTVAARLLQLGT